MKKIMVAVFCLFVVIFGFTTKAKAQGEVAFSSLSQSQFNSYINQSSWIAFVDTTGASGFTYPVNTMYSIDLFGALQTSILITNGGGNAGMTTTIVNGKFGSTGQTVSSSVNSTASIYGLVIGVFSPYYYLGSTIDVSDMYIVGDTTSHVSTVASMDNSSFEGLLCVFGEQSISFNTSFNINSDVGVTSQIYIMAIAQPIPEPSSISLAGLFVAGLIIFARRR